MTRCWPRKPTSSICPRRALRSPRTSPTLASGQVISTFMMGSSKRVPASRQAWRDAGTRLLEPIMKVEITCPEANVGDVLGDLNARRGQIEDVGFRGQQRVITAKVPLRRMFGHPKDTRSAPQGSANYSMQFDSYDAWE